MQFIAFRGMNPWPQFIMTAFVVLVSFLALFVISILVAIPVFGLDEMLGSLSGGDYNNPQTIIVLKYFQVIQSIGMFVVPPLVVAWLFEGNVYQYLHLDKKSQPKSYLLAILAVLLFNPFISVVGELNNMMTFPDFLSGLEEWMRSMEDQAGDMIEYFIKVETLGGLLFNIFMIAVIPAVGEEFLFRGVIQKIFTNMTKNYHWGIWISAILFSALHMQFFGFVPRVLLGALFGYILVYSGSLWLPILCHFVNNTIGVLALHASNKGQEDIEKITNFDFSDSLSTMWIIGIISLIITLWLVNILKKTEAS